MKPIVYIVHHVDTEGPLYEDIKETFKRLEDILHIKLNIKPTQANLNKLRNGEIDGISEDLTEKIRIIANPHLLSYKKSWGEVDEMLYRILSPDFRNKYKEQIKENLPKGMTIYGEIVGWVNETTPIMGKCSNKKLGYDYVQKYGDETIFDYGCEPGESDFYVYRITMTNEDGYVIELPTLQAKIEAEKLGLKFVPIFETFTFTTIEDLMDRVNKYVDGPDLIGHHIREGVVIRIENKDTFVAFKHKNDTFKILSGIISENMNTENMTEDMVDEMA